MALSKPIFSALGFYFEQLFNHPVRTKAISACILASAGNYTSQCLSGSKTVNPQSVLAYGLFGLLFGGTVPHYFYKFMEGVVPDEAAFSIAKRLIMERLIYAPLYQAFTLYILARMELKDHNAAMKQLFQLYWPVLTASWKYLTILQVINFSLIPPMLRVLFMNIVGFVWIVYISNKRRQQQAKSK